MTLKPSGRVIIGADGKPEHVMLDDTPGADNSRAHGYDLKPGALFNAINRLPVEQREIVLAQGHAERERLMALKPEDRDAALAAIADAAKPKPAPAAPPAPPAPSASSSGAAGAMKAPPAASAGETKKGSDV